MSFAATPVDEIDGEVAVACTPASGSPASGSFRVIVRDTTPPSAPALTVSPASLWPPNHKLTTVTVAAASIDLVSPAACAIASIASNELDSGRASAISLATSCSRRAQ